VGSDAPAGYPQSVPSHHLAARDRVLPQPAHSRLPRIVCLGAQGVRLDCRLGRCHRALHTDRLRQLPTVTTIYKCLVSNRHHVLEKNHQ
jgi:hypothetical protein